MGTLSLSSRPYTSLFLLSLLHRFLSLSLLCIIPSLIVQPFDSSAQLLSPATSSSPASPWRLTDWLVRWDSIHFLGAASPEPLPASGDEVGGGGYQWEQTLAFQPGLVWLLRLAGYSVQGRWSLDAAVGWTTVLAVLSSSLCPLLLYQ